MQLHASLGRIESVAEGLRRVRPCLYSRRAAIIHTAFAPALRRIGDFFGVLFYRAGGAAQ